MKPRHLGLGVLFGLASAAAQAQVPSCASDLALGQLRKTLAGAIAEDSFGVLTAGEVQAKFELYDVKTLPASGGSRHRCAAIARVKAPQDLVSVWLDALAHPPADAEMKAELAKYGGKSPTQIHYATLTTVFSRMGGVSLLGSAGSVERARAEVNNLLLKISSEPLQLGYEIGLVERSSDGRPFFINASTDDDIRFVWAAEFSWQKLQASRPIAPVAASPSRAAAKPGVEAMVAAPVPAPPAAAAPAPAAAPRPASTGKPPSTPSSEVVPRAASFDCAKASTAAEKLICGSPKLSAADSDLALAYTEALQRSGNKDGIRQSQRDWRRVRDACGDEACMLQEYRRRSTELRAAP